MDPNPRTPVTTVDAEEREVANVGAHAKATKDLNAKSRSERNASHRPGQRATTAVQVEPQEGVPVRSISTPAQQRTNFDHESPDEAIRKANSARVQAGQGRTREEVMANMSEVDRAEYQAQLDARKAAKHVDDGPKIVGKVAAVTNQQREGFTIKNEVGGGIETFDASGSDGAAVESVAEVEGMKFTNTNMGRPKPQVPATKASTNGGDHRRKIAKSICPDFPDNYVFDDSARKKIARLQADYEDRPDVIRAVAAAESDDDMKRRLVDEFPEAFA